MKRTLFLMREEMKELSLTTVDPEDLHVRGDDLLIEALRYLSALLPPQDPSLWPAEVEDLVNSFYAIKKWYA